MFSDKLFSDEDPADMPGSEKKESTVSVLQVFTEEGAPLVPPVIDKTVRMDNNELASVLSMEICDPPIHSNTFDARISQGDADWLCLLYSASSRSARDDTRAIRQGPGSLERSRLGPRYCGSTMHTRVL